MNFFSSREGNASWLCESNGRISGGDGPSYWLICILISVFFSFFFSHFALIPTYKSIEMSGYSIGLRGNILLTLGLIQLLWFEDESILSLVMTLLSLYSLKHSWLWFLGPRCGKWYLVGDTAQLLVLGNLIQGVLLVNLLW